MTTPIIVTGALGRMGKIITELVRQDADCTLAGLIERADCVAKVSADDCPVGDSPETLLPKAKGAVVVDFTAPEASMHLARTAAMLGNPVVIGTTGLTDAHKAELQELAQRIPLFWAPNMSIGINVLLKILPELARMLGDGYDMEMVELHHNRKKDAPSGTALRLAECLAEARGWDLKDTACCQREGIIGARPHAQIGVQAIRGGDVVGVHTVYFMGAGERIEVTHHAHSRENFAQGALRAAKWLKKQPSGKLYSMLDVF